MGRFLEVWRRLELLEGLPPSNLWNKDERGDKVAWQEESEEERAEFEDISDAELKSLWSRIRPRRWNLELLEVYRSDAEGCPSKNLKFKTTAGKKG